MPGPESKPSLSQQYGGIHPTGWVDGLPPSWIPYVQLSRLSPPAGLFLIYFPHVFGVAHAASTHGYVLYDMARVCLVLLGGSFFCNNASHAWNDLIDAPIDKKIHRTKNRPIPRGAISPKGALIFTVSQAFGAASFLMLLPWATTKAAIPTVVVTIYYPYAKRHTHFAQLFLGFCLSWGTMVGSTAMGVAEPWRDVSAVCLFLASVSWVAIFDTIYAHQDLSEDLKVGVKSTAVKFKGKAKPFLWSLFTCMAALLACSGIGGGMGLAYYLISMGGCITSVGVMILRVDLGNPVSCWHWFSNGFWFTGASVAAGLLAECMVRGLF
jgi:4-hydroxybenzoate polyprenyltransferase